MYNTIPDILTINECKEILKLGRNSILELIHEEKLPAFKIKGMWRIKKDDLMAMENGKIIFTDNDLTHCAVKLCQKMCKKDVQFLTLIFGEDVTEEISMLQYKRVVDGKLDIIAYFEKGKRPFQGPDLCPV